MLTIYGRCTAWNVRKVLFFLEEAGLAYERHDFGRGFKPTTTPEFLALNPNGFVPVLVHDGFVLWESHAILRYLANTEQFSAYYPADRQKRALVDQWLDWKNAHIAAPMRPLFFRLFLKMGEFSDRELTECEAECAKSFGVLDQHLAEAGPYVLGHDLTIADCALGMAVHRWLSLELSRPSLTHVEAYYERLTARPAFRKTIMIGIP